MRDDEYIMTLILETKQYRYAEDAKDDDDENDGSLVPISSVVRISQKTIRSREMMVKPLVGLRRQEKDKERALRVNEREGSKREGECIKVQ